MPLKEKVIPLDKTYKGFEGRGLKGFLQNLISGIIKLKCVYLYISFRQNWVSAKCCDGMIYLNSFNAVFM